MFRKAADLTEGVHIKYMSFSGETGMADLALYAADGAEALANGEAGTLWFALAVPDAMAFEPGEGGPCLAEGGTRCIECGGSGRRTYCAGSGSTNYGDGYEECIICEGSGTCDVCDGEGKY